MCYWFFNLTLQCNYTEFWLKYTNYLENYERNLFLKNGGDEQNFKAVEARKVYKNVTGRYLKKRPDIHLSFVAFEEHYKNYDGAREVFDKLMEIGIYNYIYLGVS